MWYPRHPTRYKRSQALHHMPCRILDTPQTKQETDKNKRKQSMTLKLPFSTSTASEQNKSSSEIRRF